MKFPRSGRWGEAGAYAGVKPGVEVGARGQGTFRGASVDAGIEIERQ